MSKIYKYAKLWKGILFILLCNSAFSAALYVAKNGNDNNPGTQTQPYLTINKAAQTAFAGDTIIIGDGLYRECIKPLRGGTSEDNRITYQAASGAVVTIKGSEQITNWSLYSGNTYRVVLSNASYFSTYNPYNSLHGLSETGWMANYTCGDVYLNGDAFYEKFSINDVTANSRTWYCAVDSTNTTIYANFSGANPNTSLAEINVRKQCFAPATWGLGYITIKGLKVMHSANSYADCPSWPEHAQYGAISVYGGLKWIIEDCTVINARSIGIDLGLGCDEWAGNKGTAVRTYYYNTNQYGQHIVRNCRMEKCGQSAIAGVFSWKTQVLNNVVLDSNYRKEFMSMETAGIKMHYNNDGLIEGNYIAGTINSSGCWLDWGNQGIRFTKNVCVDNSDSIECEAMHGPALIDNNVFINGRFYQCDTRGVVIVHNLFYNSNWLYTGEGRG